MEIYTERQRARRVPLAGGQEEKAQWEAAARTQLGISTAAPGPDPRAPVLRAACTRSDRVKAIITCSRSATQMGSRKCGAELPV